MGLWEMSMEERLWTMAVLFGLLAICGIVSFFNNSKNKKK